MNAESQYLEILRDILENGVKKDDRTGVGTLSLYGKSIRHSYEGAFPLLTTKKMFTRGIIEELLWFLKGTEDASYLVEKNVHIWDQWMTDDKKLPHTYGVKWRNFDGVDQIARLIDEVKTNPLSRRHVVSAWDPSHVNDAALTWCHVMFQLFAIPNEYLPEEKRTDTKGRIGMTVYQRSADFF